MAAVVQRRQIRRPTGGLSGIAAPKSSASSTSSRSGSPHTGSFIPQPKSAVVTRDRTANGDRSRPSSTASASSISHLPVKSAGVPVRQQQTSGAQSNGSANGHLIKGSSHLSSAHNGGAVVGNNNANHNNNSMLDKFKFFNSKDKSQDKSKVPKRPTSSGGFSSARSERSDSSVSLCGTLRQGARQPVPALVRARKPRAKPSRVELSSATAARPTGPREARMAPMTSATPRRPRR